MKKSPFASKVLPELYKFTNSLNFKKREIIGHNPNIANRTLKEVSINASDEHTIRLLGNH